MTDVCIYDKKKKQWQDIFFIHKYIRISKYIIRRRSILLFSSNCSRDVITRKKRDAALFNPANPRVRAIYFPLEKPLHFSNLFGRGRPPTVSRKNPDLREKGNPPSIDIADALGDNMS